MEQPNYYSILIAEVRYDRNLTDFAKILYSEITALSNKEGYCWADNAYFAELYDKNVKTISVSISALEDRGYLKVEIDQKSGNKRKMYIGIEKNVNTSLQESKDPSLQKGNEVPDTINTTSINTKSNTKMNKENSLEFSSPHKIAGNSFKRKSDTSMVKVTPKASAKELISYFKEKLGLPMLGGAEETNERYGIHLIKKHKDISKIRTLIDIVASDDYWRTKISSMQDLYFKDIAIINSTRKTNKYQGSSIQI